MQYGLIGEKLGHSFSAEIHAKLKSNPYALIELSREEVEAFFREKNFSAVNVTIPYKTAVIPYLTYIDEQAKAIGAVNTVVNRGGELWGYNTDFYGLQALIGHAGVTVKHKKIAILGTGGTSKTARAVAASLGAAQILVVSRTAGEGVITYADLVADHQDIDVLINTTPVGMFPNTEAAPVNISAFPKLSGVIDAIYNPLRTQLILEAQKRGIPAEGGLYMLVAQAVRASELFLECTYEEETAERIYQALLQKMQNVVLSGMPASGKSTVGKLLAKECDRPFFDLDEEIVRTSGRSIPDIFATEGEATFRDIETRVLRELLTNQKGIVLATGGGAILRDENIDLLRRNGKIYFIDRPLEALLPTNDRPLASSREAICRRYEERYTRYVATADCRIDGDGSVEEVAERIRKEFSSI